ncbi:MAG: GAF and ANTAR domain-containing protein [Micromonosporaceae bacterium]
MPRPDTPLAQWFADLTRDLRAKPTVEATLDQACRVAVSTIDHCQSAGVSLVERRGQVTTAAATDDLAQKAHEIQHELGEGPCMDALWKEQLVGVDDLVTEQRWPRFVERGVALGIRSSLSFQLFTHEDTLGALNLFAERPHAFGSDAREIGLVLAAHAAVALADARNQAQLSEAISTRQRIGEAIGILAERYNITTRDAFSVLAQASQNHNVRLRDLAARLVVSEDDAREKAPGDLATDRDAGPPGPSL